MTPLQLVCVAVLLMGATFASVADHRACEEFSQNLCTIEQVRIEPCSNSKLCRLRKGYPASISFDFTPNFSASKLKAGLFSATSTGDLPFSELYEADACQLTSCPAESGKSQELTYGLHLSKKLPKGTYELKWKLWNADDESQMCCFKVRAQLRK